MIQLYFVVEQDSNKPEAVAQFYSNAIVAEAAASRFPNGRPQLRDNLNGALRLVELGCEPGDVAALVDGAAALGVTLTVFGAAPDYADSQAAVLEYLAANRAAWE